MAFILKRKRFKFQVDFMLADMSNVPFVNAVLFSKVRLLDGGAFCDYSSQAEVINHHVYWGKIFQFSCRIAANPQNGVLDPCWCKVSVRKDSKNGKSFQKLGFVNINLSEFAGSGIDGLTKTFLLEGYTSGHQRQDNSLLRVNISMLLQSADPCFKVPSPICEAASSRVALSVILLPSDRRATGDDSSATSTSSGFGSLDRMWKNHGSENECFPGHSRNGSQTSQQSQISGYASNASHSRQGSSESGTNSKSSRQATDLTTIFASSKAGTAKRVISREIIPSTSAIDSTRVDPDQLIAELMKGCDTSSGSEDRTDENSGLRLYVSKEDGTVKVVGSQEMKASLSSACFEQVIIDDHNQDESS